MNRCAKKNCNTIANKHHWFCVTHQVEWENSSAGLLSRDLTVQATDINTTEAEADELFKEACEVYKKYILSE